MYVFCSKPNYIITPVPFKGYRPLSIPIYIISEVGLQELRQGEVGCADGGESLRAGMEA